ncbi:hypothetical protein [Shinella sedimenti]|uniref:DUF4279 domain-containing protein n=1 Tax=Shinella sedimenti TaxID=2919913 RepID=A0ABT0CPZ1_9HYPH|nr:hypothetical protein [Shinella sedimenti]MCJ8150678.1 hypothetical protein [Shinella sedimenti]
MKHPVSHDDKVTDESGKATIEYSFVMRLKGVSQSDIDHFAAGIDGWRIKTGPDVIFLYPHEKDGVGGDAGDYLQNAIDRHRVVFEAAAQIGTSREISLAIYFDAERVAAICPGFNTAIIRLLADLNFSLEICVFPSSFEDDEGTEE